ncbi:hypothetical protein SAMN05421505_102287 [Sinosporangium album]|uniref:Histidine kinase/HSP90-like ATPase domain-containing protein n=1 Tax=Sinosporangium album TaxID=504805 RepID=A0A1G7SFD8_9ACTN|nr:ATP-binding protein [Sinosporangium album]SDG21728.1 hypothetical protein SAMN05421505_102287 [Sinosporangium album]
MRWDASLAEALDDRLTEWSGSTGISVETWALPDRPVPSPLADAVLAVFDEALANVERHSHALIVSVAVTYGDRGLRLTISDNGIGFDATLPGPGVLGMRRRFTDLGGSLTVNSVPGEGTTISASAPRR